ncbi:endolytic transglycosylase MltG [Granulicella sibirica]|uniref:Endolytic murein transglycosylase n=1 Tax=Granulicella sibirica TaxID=2479048 RepID=A0A4V1L6A2_9BACT|nr:endolytic transglycosylase MltG [Granulicella sibirica]RXH58554.1 protein YceG like [Granulicella sibirica]
MRIFRFLVLLVVIGAAVLAFWVLAPVGPSTETFVDIPSGTGSDGMAKQLQQAGVIRSQFAFLLMRVVKGGRLKAGEYRFDHPAPMAEVYGRLVKGDVYTRTVVIPEGFNLWDIGAAMAAAGLGTQEQFLEAARKHVELIAAWSPQAVSLEGYLFPDTYRFSRHASEEQMLTVMVKRFRQEAALIGLSNGTLDVGKTVTMASLVEKEVSVDSERAMVAGVFVNRMDKGMPLQTDPSVVYGAMLDGRWRGTIYRSDLQSDSAYNTYKHVGLTPGPICSPGIAALKAAISPAQTENLYFVADAAGHSRFSATLAEHEANVKSYRQAAGGK